MLAKANVSAFANADNEAYSIGGEVKARLLANGKFVAICLALNAKDYKKLFKAASETKAYEDTTMMVTLKAPRDVQRVKELLDKLFD